SRREAKPTRLSPPSGREDPTRDGSADPNIQVDHLSSQAHWWGSVIYRHRRRLRTIFCSLKRQT
ncbi:hypothetical protein AVEN_194140-1, partial [Araneus ventricosus]